LVSPNELAYDRVFRWFRDRVAGILDYGVTITESLTDPD